MTFPNDFIRGEILINGVWTEVTNRIRGSGDIRINSGTRIDSTDLAPSTIDFVLNNADGLFTNDNPNSQYFGLLPANTNFRVSMEETLPFLFLPNSMTDDPATTASLSSYIQTADKAVLDVTGDLDLRIDLEADVWQLGNVGQVLAGKFQTTSNQCSWAWTIESFGRLKFWWSADGTTVLSATSTASITTGARTTLRVTIDVNNGASGNTVTFYTSDSVTGTFTQLGAPVVTAGTTSIFSSSAPLQVGSVRDVTANTYPFAAVSPPSVPLVGRVHRFQMRNGLAGTLVADMNATAQADNAASWSDGLGTPNTWSANGLAYVTVADYRGYGEMAEMPQDWDTTGRDVYCSVAAAGIARRITKDPKVIRSAFRRYNDGLTTSNGYWAMEDPAGSVQAFNAVRGASLGGQVGLGFGSQYFPTGSAPLADIGSADSFIIYRYARSSATNVGWQIGWVARYNPFTDNPFPFLLTMDVADTTDYVITLDVGSKIIEVFAQNTSGGIIADTTATYSDDWTEWHSFVLKATQVGGTVHIDLYWRSFDDGAWKTIGTTFAGTTSIPVNAQFSGGDVPPDSTVGHMIGTVGVTEDLIAEARFQAFVGYVGESALARWLRICRENNIRALAVGWPADTAPMGPQPITTVANILDECAATDSGIQYESRDQAALVFRTRASLYAQQAITLDYASAHLSGLFRPTPDDLLTKNSVTATNPSGANYTSTITSGPKSTQASPNGVGEYDSGLAVNAASDDTGLQDAASWATYLGTWPARRVPSIQAQLVRAVYTASATLSRAVRSVNLGDRLVVANVPIWVGGGSADTLVRAYVETIQNSGSARGWLLDFATVPGGPFTSIPVLGSDVAVPRLDTTASATGATLTTTGTSVTLTTPVGQAVWVDSTNYPAEFPFRAVIAGEEVSVTAISGTASPQTATLVRSQNGIVKAHTSTGRAFRLANPFYLGR